MNCRPALPMIVGGLLVVLALAPAINASTMYYAHPESVDLSKDRNVVITAPAGAADTYQQFGRTDFTGSPSATYQIDLGLTEPVGNIQFVPYTEGANNWGSQNWTIQTSTDGASWFTVSSGTNPLLYTGDATSINGGQARYVRLQATSFTQSNFFIVKGLHVYGEAGSQLAIRDTLNLGSTPGNNATATITDASNNHITGETHINDADPNDGTFLANTFGLNGGAGLGTASEIAGSPRDITLTLNSDYLLKGLRWSFWQGFDVSAYQVYASLNAGPETLVRTYNNPSGSPSWFYDPFDGSYGIDGVHANMLRIHVTAIPASLTSGTYPNELEVFGTQFVPEPSSVMLLGLGGLLVWRRARRLA